MGILINAKRVVGNILVNTGMRISNTIVPMTAKEGIDKITKLSGAIEKTIPLSTEQLKWFQTLCETVDWSKHRVARVVVRMDDFTVIMTITQNHLMFDGSALLATINGTQGTAKD